MAIDSSALVALSDTLASTVERVAPSIVAVEGRDRLGSSGFYVRPDLILTADHALEYDEIEVVGADGVAHTAEIAGRDPSTDIALLRVHGSGVPLEFAPASALRVGALALALTRDDDGDLAAAMGVLSAVGGAWTTHQGGEIDAFVRPDVSLYPRFSGSPLFDAAGRVLGMTTGGLSRRHDLAVPASTLTRVIEALLAGGGTLARGYLGVHLQPIPLGVIILAVEPDGPADRGGLFVGDVIVGIDGADAHDIEDVHRRLGSASVGSSLTLDVIRAGAQQRVAVTIGARPETEE